MNDNFSKKASQSTVLRNLISVHRKFQEELDVITSTNNDPAFIESLIELRKFNINCTNRYTAMLIKSDFDLRTPKNNGLSKKLNIPEAELMWRINHELSILIQIYQEAVHSGDINEFNRMIIARNLDEIIRQKDEILHPVNEFVLN